MHRRSRRYSQASSAYFSARSSSPAPMDIEDSVIRDTSPGPRRKKPRLSRSGKRSLSATPPETPPTKRVRLSASKVPDFLDGLSVKALKDKMAAFGMSCTGLVEKAELVAALRKYFSVQAASTSAAANIAGRFRAPAAAVATCAATAAAAIASRTQRKSIEEVSELCRIEKVIRNGGNFREILGLGLCFSAQDISALTRKIYRAVHPDKVPPGLKDRASAVFDAVRKAEIEATKQTEKRLKVKPSAVRDMKFSATKDVVTVKWRLAEDVVNAARPDRFQLAAGTSGFRVEQGVVPSACGEDGWFEFSLSTVSRKGNDRLFASRAFYFYVLPLNEAGYGVESKLLVTLDGGGLAGLLRRHNTF